MGQKSTKSIKMKFAISSMYLSIYIYLLTHSLNILVELSIHKRTNMRLWGNEKPCIGSFVNGNSTKISKVLISCCDSTMSAIS